MTRHGAASLRGRGQCPLPQPAGGLAQPTAMARNWRCSHCEQVAGILPQPTCGAINQQPMRSHP